MSSKKADGVHGTKHQRKKIRGDGYTFERLPIDQPLSKSNDARGSCPETKARIDDPHNVIGLNLLFLQSNNLEIYPDYVNGEIININAITNIIIKKEWEAWKASFKLQIYSFVVKDDQ